MKTGKDKTIAGLEALGCKLDTTARTNKYLVYRRDDHTWIVGRAGGLRSIRGNGPITSSVSRTGTIYHKALQELGTHKESFSSTEQAEQVHRDILRSLAEKLT